MLLSCLICLLAPAGTATQPAPDLLSAWRVGRLEHPPIRESSGIVASRESPGAFWTINDGGNVPVLYAIDRTGRLLAEVPVAATNQDWEDLATDDQGRLYIADVGNNQRSRREVIVHRFPEPAARPTTQPLQPEASWHLRFDREPFDCEAMVVHDGAGFLISKRRDLGEAQVWRFDLAPSDRPVPLRHVANLPLRAPVTAADLSPDGKWLAVLTVAGPTLLRINGDLSNAGAAPSSSLFCPEATMEALCFAGDGLLVTSERRDVLFFPMTRFAVALPSTSRPAIDH